MEQREGAFVVTNSHVTVCVSHWISFYFFSSSDLHKHFSLLDDTYDTYVLIEVNQKIQLLFCYSLSILFILEKTKT